MAYAIVGTAGHVDHGKTTLVQALTGTNTDRLAEEQRRGMTLDLGFTWFDVDEHRMAVIDVPGHEKYIANMLSGVAAIDIGLLVVAADEGVAVQTREHLNILASLSVPHLVVAMTRMDLADDITAEIVESDILEMTADAGYADVSVIRVTAPTGQGIEELKRCLVERAALIVRPEPTGPFRMPIDRSFTVAGRGCVVAGTVWQGRINAGDQLQVLPGGQSVRVREVELHGDTSTGSQAGYRTALNLVGISHKEILRGCELVTEGAFRPSERCVAEVRMFADAPEIPNGRVVRMHSAAGSCAVRILTGGGSLAPGEKSVAVLKCETPTLLTPGQPLLLRRPGASGTFAGGRVLASQRLEGRRTGALVEFGQRLMAAPPEEAIATWLDLLGFLDLDDDTVPVDLGFSAGALQSVVDEGVKAATILRVPDTRIFVSRSGVELLNDQLMQRLEARSRDGRAAWTDEASLTEEGLRLAPLPVIRWLIERLIEAGRIIRLNRQITSASSMNLSTSQQELFSMLLDLYNAERQPPNATALPQQTSKPRKDIDALIKLAVSQGLLVNLGDGWFLTPAVLDELQTELSALFATKPELTVADIRDHWGLTRKHAVPFLEYFDRSGRTVRTDNIRTHGTNLPAP